MSSKEPCSFVATLPLATLVSRMCKFSEEFSVAMTRESLAMGMAPYCRTLGDLLKSSYTSVYVYIEKLCQAGAIDVNGAWYSIDWSVMYRLMNGAWYTRNSRFLLLNERLYSPDTPRRV